MRLKNVCLFVSTSLITAPIPAGAAVLLYLDNLIVETEIATTNEVSTWGDVKSR